MWQGKYLSDWSIFSHSTSFWQRQTKKAPMLSLFDEESKIVTSGLGNHKFRVAGIAGKLA